MKRYLVYCAWCIFAPSQLSEVTAMIRTFKPSIFFDYQTRIVAYKDLVESRCLLELLKSAETQNYGEQHFADVDKDRLVEQNILSKRQIWYIGGQRIADFCSGFPTFLIQEQQEENAIARVRRSPQPFYRIRGQTQSQYLSFGKEPGKAEAQSTYEGTKAVVSGTNGMGQAQSQSSPLDCQDCYGYPEQGSESRSQYPAGFAPHSTGFIQQTPSGLVFRPSGPQRTDGSRPSASVPGSQQPTDGYTGFQQSGSLPFNGRTSPGSRLSGNSNGNVPGGIQYPAGLSQASLPGSRYPGRDFIPSGLPQARLPGSHYTGGDFKPSGIPQAGLPSSQHQYPSGDFERPGQPEARLPGSQYPAGGSRLSGITTESPISQYPAAGARPSGIPEGGIPSTQYPAGGATPGPQYRPGGFSGTRQPGSRPSGTRLPGGSSQSQGTQPAGSGPSSGHFSGRIPQGPQQSTRPAGTSLGTARQPQQYSGIRRPSGSFAGQLNGEYQANHRGRFSGTFQGEYESYPGASSRYPEGPEKSPHSAYSGPSQTSYPVGYGLGQDSTGLGRDQYSPGLYHPGDYRPGVTSTSYGPGEDQRYYPGSTGQSTGIAVGPDYVGRGQQLTPEGYGISTGIPGTETAPERYPGYTDYDAGQPGLQGAGIDRQSGSSSGLIPSSAIDDGQHLDYPGVGGDDAAQPGLQQSGIDRTPITSGGSIPVSGSAYGDGQGNSYSGYNARQPSILQESGIGSGPTSSGSDAGHDALRPGLQGSGIGRGTTASGIPSPGSIGSQGSSTYPAELGTQQGPSSETSEDQDSESQAQAEAHQSLNGTQAQAIIQNFHRGFTSQTQVSGTHSGSGSFSASAGTSDPDRASLTQISGDASGASSTAQGRSLSAQSQAGVLISSGETSSSAQTSGLGHQSQSVVKGGSTGGSTQAQASGPGLTSSQAHIGFQPYEESDQTDQKAPFQGGGTAAAQSGRYSGQTQSQIQGKFNYGIKYTGSAQSGSDNRGTGLKPYLNLTQIRTNFTGFKPFLIGSNNSTRHVRDQMTVVPIPETESSTDDPDYDYEESSSSSPMTKSISHHHHQFHLDPVEDLDVTVVQTPSVPILQPGDFIPGSPGYRIPAGFRGRLTSSSVASRRPGRVYVDPTGYRSLGKTRIIYAHTNAQH